MNFREELLKLDMEDYKGLTNMYEAVKLSDKDKKSLFEMLTGESVDANKIQMFLATKQDLDEALRFWGDEEISANKALSATADAIREYLLNNNINFDQVIYDVFDYGNAIIVTGAVQLDAHEAGEELAERLEDEFGFHAEINAEDIYLDTTEEYEDEWGNILTRPSTYYLEEESDDEDLDEIKSGENLSQKSLVESSDRYTIEINNEILTDEFGNDYIFDSYEEAQDYIIDQELVNAEVVRQYGFVDDESNQDAEYQVLIVNTDYEMDPYFYYKDSDADAHVAELHEMSDDELFENNILAYAQIDPDDSVIDMYISSKADYDKANRVLNGEELDEALTESNMSNIATIKKETEEIKKAAEDSLEAQEAQNLSSLETEDTRKEIEQAKDILKDIDDKKFTEVESKFDKLTEAEDSTNWYGKYDDPFYRVKDIANSIDVNSPEYRGAPTPAYDPEKINPTAFADEMRPKYWETFDIDEEGFNLVYVTQEPFDQRDGAAFVKEVRRAITELANKRFEYEEPFTVDLHVEPRDGAEYGVLDKVIHINEINESIRTKSGMNRLKKAR